jgi:hypothetical protein
MQQPRMRLPSRNEEKKGVGRVGSWHAHVFRQASKHNQ